MGKNKGAWFLVIVVFLVVMAGMMNAAGKSQVQGSIAALNTAAQRIDLKQNDGQVRAFFLEPSTKIMLDGQAASLNDLKAGQAVKLKQASRNGQKVVTEIAASTTEESSTAAQAPSAEQPAQPASSAEAPAASSSAAAPTAQKQETDVTPTPASPESMSQPASPSPSSEKTWSTPATGPNEPVNPNAPPAAAPVQ